MGDASLPPREHVVVLLPLEEKKSVTDAIRKKHPHITLDYHFIDMKALGVKGFNIHSVPDGISP